MTQIERANREAELLIPRLQALKGKGDGARIHDVNKHLGLIQMTQKLMNTTKREQEEVADLLLDCTKAATEFLVSTLG